LPFDGGYRSQLDNAVPSLGDDAALRQRERADRELAAATRLFTEIGLTPPYQARPT
jgi:hypothetical protein